MPKAIKQTVTPMWLEIKEMYKGITGMAELAWVTKALSEDT